MVDTAHQSIVDSLNDLIAKSNRLNEMLDKAATEPALQALQLAKANNLPQWQVKSLVTLSSAYLYSHSNPPQAIKLCEEAYEIAKALDDTPSLLEVFAHLALAYVRSGDIEASHQYHLKAIELAEENKSPDKKELNYLGTLYFNLVSQLDPKKDAHRFITNLDKALELFTRAERRRSIAYAYVAYSVYHDKHGNRNLGFEYQEKAIAILEEFKDEDQLIRAYINMAFMHIDAKEFDKGIKYLQSALEKALLIQNTNSIIEVNMHIGLAYTKMGETELAISTYLTCETILHETKNKQYQCDVYTELIKIYELQGKFENANEYHKKYIEVKIEVMDMDKTAAILLEHNKNEIQKQKEEAAALLQKKTEIEGYARKLEISNKALEQFAHIASHDLKEPLRTISGYISLFDQQTADKLNEEEKHFLSVVVKGVGRMDVLINDLLALSKVTATTKLQPLDLNQVMKEILTNIADLCTRSKAEVKTSLLPIIQADKTQMLQLFQNLITNAIKYNKSSVPKVGVSYIYDKGAYIFSITDNGIGIPEQFRERVFMLFQRLHTREQYSGTGIGLSICRKIVDEMRGQIWVEENPNGGSVFKIRLPNLQ